MPAREPRPCSRGWPGPRTRGSRRRPSWPSPWPRSPPTGSGARRRSSFPTADYAEIELYTRLAAEGSQRLGPEARFHFHHPGPGFFYAAAPIYQLLGADSAAMAWAALAWNLVALAALLRGASRIVPGTGPMLAALLLCLLLQAQGLGWLFSSWNPNVGLLPFGVALLAAARLATGEGRALAIVVLAGSLAIQSHMVFALPVALVSAAGLALATFPRLRRGLGVPTVRPRLRRAIAARGPGRAPAAVGAAAPRRARRRLRQPPPFPGGGGKEPAAQPVAGGRRGRGERVLGLRRRPRRPGLRFTLARRRRLLAVALAWAGRRAARRRAPATALALVTAAGMLAALAVARTAPGALSFGYVLYWVALVGVAAALVVGAEAASLWPGWPRPAGKTGPRPAGPGLRPAARGQRARVARGGHPSPPPRLGPGRSPRAGRPRPARFRDPVALPPARRPGRGPAGRARPDPGLDKAHLRFTVEPFGPYLLVGRFTPRGDEVGQLLLGDIPPTGRAKPVAVAESFPVVWQAVAPPAP